MQSIILFSSWNIHEVKHHFRNLSDLVHLTNSPFLVVSTRHVLAKTLTEEEAQKEAPTPRKRKKKMCWIIEEWRSRSHLPCSLSSLIVTLACAFISARYLVACTTAIHIHTYSVLCVYVCVGVCVSRLVEGRLLEGPACPHWGWLCVPWAQCAHLSTASCAPGLLSPPLFPHPASWLGVRGG